jgi:hypothetical protein
VGGLHTVGGVPIEIKKPRDCEEHQTVCEQQMSPRKRKTVSMRHLNQDVLQKTKRIELKRSKIRPQSSWS